MEIKSPQRLLSCAIIAAAARTSIQKFYKNGIEVEKGAIITRQRIEKNRHLYEVWYNFWMCYPDLLN